jgi:hypothetical protein
MNNEKQKFDVGDFVKVIPPSDYRPLLFEPLLGKHGIITSRTLSPPDLPNLQVFLAGLSGTYWFEETHLELVAKA